MNRKEAMRLAHQENTLQSLGFTQSEAESLRRISMTLHRWFEAECNGEIQRGDDGIARGYRVHARYIDPNDPRYWYSVRDRETGACKRLAGIIKTRNARNASIKHAAEDCPGKPCSTACDHVENPEGIVLSSYIQTDPRSAALYILRPGDVPEGADPSAYYSRGICVY